MFRSDRNRSRDYQTSRGRRSRGQRRTRKTTLRSERRSLLKKDLTEPTLLEMSDKRVNQELACPVLGFGTPKNRGALRATQRNTSFPSCRTRSTPEKSRRGRTSGSSGSISGCSPLPMWRRVLLVVLYPGQNRKGATVLTIVTLI